MQLTRLASASAVDWIFNLNNEQIMSIINIYLPNKVLGQDLTLIGGISL